MDLKEIENHWKDWATKYGMDIRATEKSKTRKPLEVDALIRGIKAQGRSETDKFSVLEVGCGTGHNCLALAQAFPSAEIIGVDYIAEMVENAKELQSKVGLNNIKYFQGDLFELGKAGLPRQHFDVVFTCRCIINLNTHDLQAKAISELCKRVSDHGTLMLGENPQHKYVKQNKLRSHLGLEARTPPDFNLLIDESNIIDAARASGLELEMVDDFSSLHDTLLYVLIPAINGGQIDYDHPIMEAAKDLCSKVYSDQPNAFGDFGQNRLYVFCKES